MAEHHELMGGKVRIYKRDRSRIWQCATYLKGRSHRVSTGHDSLSLAKDFAEDWYLELRGKSREGPRWRGKSFKQAATQFEREYEVITQGERNPRYVQRHKDIIRLHLTPFFGRMSLNQITAGQVQEYRIHRHQNPVPRHRQKPETLKPPSRSTLHHEIVTLRQILKCAQRHGWLTAVPDLSPPFRASGKVIHRAWFSPEEYKRLYRATRERARKPKRKRWKWHAEQMHDYVLFMANTGLRPDEAARLEFRDVKVINDTATVETILEIEVRGKRGIGYCKSTAGAVRPFERLQARPRPKLKDASEDTASAHEENGDSDKPPSKTDRLFPFSQRELFNNILEELDLKTDRDGRSRAAYSLRHTYICLRLMEGADIYQIAKNCRTSVEMIETFYAAHIANTLDAAAINVRKSRKKESAASPNSKAA